MKDSAASQTYKSPVLPAYRPDIDGLRAIAILSVVIYHAFPSKLPGGFLGVDIFFVISGFLISTIIFRGLEKKDFSLVKFYAHRVNRIFPALITVLAACYAFGWFVLLPDEFKQLGKHMAAGAGFVQNFALWKESGYFDVAAESKPLLHLWSLAIEEQFYLIFPILILVVWRIGLNALTIVVTSGLISFVLNAAGVVKNPIETFFLPQTRAWELLVGSILAYIQFFNKEKFSAWIQNFVFHSFFFRSPPQAAKRVKALNDIFSVFGFLLIFSAILIVDKSRAFPGWWALLPVFGAFFLILAAPDAWGNRVILSNKLMVFVGLISYPLYLWHWPILSFARIIEGAVPSLEIRVGAIALSFFLAWLTYRLIEKPIRFGKQTWIKTVSLTMLLALVGYIGYNAFKRNGMDFRAKQFTEITKAAGEWDYPGGLLSGSLEGIHYFYKKSEKQNTTLFVGDSNIEQYSPRAEALIASDPTKVNGVIFKTGGGCLAIPGQSHDTAHKHCVGLMQSALTIAKQKPEIDTVVIGGLWNAYLSSGGAMEKKYGVGSVEYMDALDKLGGYITELVGMNKRVFLILSIPTGAEIDPKYMVQRDLKSFPKVLSIRFGGVSRSDLEEKFGKIQEDLAQVAISSGAAVIDPKNFLCAESCSGVDADGDPIYKDGAHLRPKYVGSKAKFIDETLL